MTVSPRRHIFEASGGGVDCCTKRSLLASLGEQSCKILPTKRRLVRKGRGHMKKIQYPVATAAAPSRDSSTCFVVVGPCSLSRENALVKSVHKLSDPLSTVRGDKLPEEINKPDPYGTLLVWEFLHIQDGLASRAQGSTEPSRHSARRNGGHQHGEFFFDGVGLLATNAQRSNKVQDTYVPFFR